MWYFCQERSSVGRIYSKLGGCVPHGGAETAVSENGGSFQLVGEIRRFGSCLNDLDAKIVTP